MAIPGKSRYLPISGQFWLFCRDESTEAGGSWTASAFTDADLPFTLCRAVRTASSHFHLLAVSCSTQDFHLSSSLCRADGTASSHFQLVTVSLGTQDFRVEVSVLRPSAYGN